MIKSNVHELYYTDIFEDSKLKTIQGLAMSITYPNC